MTDSTETNPPLARAVRHAGLILRTIGASETRLPTERQLVVKLGISRTAVRNALAYLEETGVISREVGRGTFLSTDNGPSGGSSNPLLGSSNLRVDLNNISPRNVMEVRFVIEAPAMALVAAEATTEDFNEMDRCLLGGSTAGNYEEFESWDLALHRCLIAASHNPLLVSVYASVEAARHGPLWGDLKRRNDSQSGRESYQREHQVIVDCLKERNARGARDAMLRHLQSIETSLKLQLSL
jgi:DNA-binding FadR family transcriptional regulator